MMQVLYILLATCVTALTSLLTGSALLNWCATERVTNRTLFTNRGEAVFLSFVVGAATLACIVFGLGWLGLAQKSAFYLIAVLLCGLSAWAGGLRLLRTPTVVPSNSPPPLGLRWRLGFWTIFTVFGGLYLSIAMAPEASLDGASHYLGDVARFLDQRGFTNADFVQTMPDGMEMLFLFSYSIGKQSAAAMVELLFLLALPLGIFSYANRLGEPRAGMVAAILVFASPIAGVSGTIAAPDVAIATTAFGLFYLLDIVRPGSPYWNRRRKLLLPTALPTILLVWTITPWLLREFAKPVLHLNGFYARLPLDVAVHGTTMGSGDSPEDIFQLAGILGPVFLLAPLALIALLKPVGRKLLLAAAIFALPALGAFETRILLPSLPFLALALVLGISIARLKIVLPVILTTHAVLSWPTVVSLYAAPGVWQVPEDRWLAAFRIEPEDAFLSRELPGYRTGRIMENIVPDGDRVLTTRSFQRVYHSRTIVDGEQSVLGQRLREAIWSAVVENRKPLIRRDYRFDPQAARRVGLLPLEFDGQARWGLSELHVYSESVEIEPNAAWRVAATPNPNDGVFAVDHNPATRWSTGRAPRDSMGFTLEFGQQHRIDHIAIEVSGEQDRPVQVLLESPSGEWEPVTTTVHRFTIPPPESLRTDAIRALTDADIKWLLVHRDDLATSDILNNLDQWGLEVATINEPYVLLKIRSQ